jgi:hypothetical protein
MLQKRHHRRMRRRGVPLIVAVAVVLAAWYGVLAGLPHHHAGRTSLEEGEACTITGSGGSLEHLHPSTLRSGHATCLACLVAGTAGAVGSCAATFDSLPSASVAGPDPASPRVCDTSRLPRLRAPPAPA